MAFGRLEARIDREALDPDLVKSFADLYEILIVVDTNSVSNEFFYERGAEVEIQELQQI
jgi:hypothetical protein